MKKIKDFERIERKRNEMFIYMSKALLNGWCSYKLLMLDKRFCFLFVYHFYVGFMIVEFFYFSKELRKFFFHLSVTNFFLILIRFGVVYFLSLSHNNYAVNPNVSALSSSPSLNLNFFYFCNFVKSFIISLLDDKLRKDHSKVLNYCYFRTKLF